MYTVNPASRTHRLKRATCGLMPGISVMTTTAGPTPASGSLVLAQPATDGPQSELPFSAPLEAEGDELGEALDAIDPDELSPRQALEKLFALKKIRDE